MISDKIILINSFIKTLMIVDAVKVADKRDMSVTAKVAFNQNANFCFDKRDLNQMPFARTRIARTPFSIFITLGTKGRSLCAVLLTWSRSIYLKQKPEISNFSVLSPRKFAHFFISNKHYVIAYCFS